jgi:hypothetical protein
MPFTNAYATYVATDTVGDALPRFDASNAYIGVGDGTTAFSPSQTDLQGINKFRKAMDPGYPTVSGNTMTFRATFNTNEANFPWNEWGIFNATTGGTMMNRKVVSLGTKDATQTWVLTVQVVINV